MYVYFEQLRLHQKELSQEDRLAVIMNIYLV